MINKKLISILGSTGSIASSVFEIIHKKKNSFRINLLSANKNYNLISNQIKKYKPKYFFINNKDIFNDINKKFKNFPTKIINSLDKVKFSKKNDITISAIPGIDGLKPTIIMTKLSKKILIANKESIICGWNLIKSEAIKNKTEIVPIDSEHFSIQKLIENHSIAKIKKIYITASGGPFLNYRLNQFKNIKPKDAIRHPKWKMGKKISVDSSTLMNKILELIEATKLFNIPINKLDILIHPNSLIHAIVEFKNGLTKFLYHKTSMTIPIANAIFGENFDIDKFFNKKNKEPNFFQDNLIFKKVDPKRFPVIKLKNRVTEYAFTPIIINASNEILVDQFLKKNIQFPSIYKIIMDILKDVNYKKYAIRKTKNIMQIYEIHNWAKGATLKRIKYK